MRSTLRSLCFVLIVLGLSGWTLACGPGTGDDAATTPETTAKDAEPPAEDLEPAQFRDGFESGDTSKWSNEGGAADDDSTTSDDGPAEDPAN